MQSDRCRTYVYLNLKTGFAQRKQKIRCGEIQKRTGESQKRNRKCQIRYSFYIKAIIMTGNCNNVWARPVPYFK